MIEIALARSPGSGSDAEPDSGFMQLHRQGEWLVIVAVTGAGHAVQPTDDDGHVVLGQHRGGTIGLVATDDDDLQVAALSPGIVFGGFWIGISESL